MSRCWVVGVVHREADEICLSGKCRIEYLLVDATGVIVVKVWREKSDYPFTLTPNKVYKLKLSVKVYKGEISGTVLEMEDSEDIDFELLSWYEESYKVLTVDGTIFQPINEIVKSKSQNRVNLKGKVIIKNEDGLSKITYTVSDESDKVNLVVWNNCNIELKFEEGMVIYVRNVRVSTWSRERIIEYQYTIDKLTDCVTTDNCDTFIIKTTSSNVIPLAISSGSKRSAGPAIVACNKKLKPDESYDYLFTVLQRNLATSEVSKATQTDMLKIISTSDFNDAVITKVVSYLKKKESLKFVLLQGLTEGLDSSNEIFFDIFKACIQQYNTKKEQQLLQYFIQKTQPQVTPLDLDVFLKEEKND